MKTEVGRLKESGRNVKTEPGIEAEKALTMSFLAAYHIGGPQGMCF